MKVCNVTRNGVFYLLSNSFKRLGKSPRIVELGVLRGDNAQVMRAALAPDLTVLVDSWSISALGAYKTANSHRSWVEPLEVHAAYFHGNPFEHATHEANYQAVKYRFAGASDVKILRMETRAAFAELERLSDNKGFDLIYIDANHQYEAVLDDLLGCRSLLSPLGVLMLNDCCHSTNGIKQNLGVLEAACKFIKMTGFVPVVLTNTDFSDLVLAPAGSPMINAIHRSVTQSPVHYVELPPQLLANAQVRAGVGRMSFV